MRRLIIIIGLCCTVLCWSQEGKITDFLNKITKYDISHLWTMSKFQAEDDTIIIEREDPIGYIGGNFQRFYILRLNGYIYIYINE